MEVCEEEEGERRGPSPALPGAGWVWSELEAEEV